MEGDGDDHFHVILHQLSLHPFLLKLLRGVHLALISSSLDIMQEKCFCVGACLLVFLPVQACIHALSQLIHLSVWFDWLKAASVFANPVFITQEREPVLIKGNCRLVMG